jgi:branched-subunit amino acid transport protein
VVTLWLAVGLAGMASFAFRALPLLAAERIRLRPRARDALRHAGVGAVTALIVASVRAAPAGGRDVRPAVALALLVGAVLAWRGRSMTWVVVAGLASFAVASAALQLL